MQEVVLPSKKEIFQIFLQEVLILGLLLRAGLIPKIRKEIRLKYRQLSSGELGIKEIIELSSLKNLIRITVKKIIVYLTEKKSS